MGIAFLPTFICGRSMQDGKVVEILAGAAQQEFGIHAVYPEGPYMQPKLRAFIDFLAARLKRVDEEL